jgi:4'-phosphopantetheinyl transferase
VTIYWLLQQAADVPEHDGWLSPFELSVLGKLWAPKRRRDWRLGRWTAKCALVRAGALGKADADLCEWTRLSIRADEAGVPRLFLDDVEGEWETSISHSGELGMAAVARRTAAVGCDIETIGRRGEEFVIDWFTDSERQVVSSVDADARSRVVTAIWSAKESALKALGVGLRLDTRQVEVRIATADLSLDIWRPVDVAAPGRVLHGWFRIERDVAMSLLSDAAPDPPVAL